MKQEQLSTKWFKEFVRCCYNCGQWQRGKYGEAAGSKYNHCNLISKGYLTSWDNCCYFYDGHAPLVNELEGIGNDYEVG